MARRKEDDRRPSAADPVYVVFNPMSGRGRGAQLVSPLLQALAGAPGLEHGLTREPGDEARLTTDALARGFRRIVAVGGDGTWSNVGNAILRSGIPAGLGLVPGGTGCDLAKSLGIPRDLQACARIVLNGHRKSIDVGRIEDRYFLNLAGFGYDVAVIEDSWSVGYLGGAPLYLYCAIRQLRSFRGFSVEVEADGQPLGRPARRDGFRQHGLLRAGAGPAAAAGGDARGRRARERHPRPVVPAALRGAPDLRDRRGVEPGEERRPACGDPAPGAEGTRPPARGVGWDEGADAFRCIGGIARVGGR